MPSRILRDGIIESLAVNSLDWEAELFYRRLMSIVDDYGRYSAIPQLLASRCYPLQVDKVNAKMISGWLQSCSKAGLVSLYQCAEGKPTLEINNFDQRTRTKSKFPENPDAKSKRNTNAGQMTAECEDECVVEDEGVYDSGKKKATKKRVKELPGDWEPNEHHTKIAEEERIDLKRAKRIFVDWAIGGGKQYVNWDRTFSGALRTWLADKARKSGRDDVPLDPLGKPLKRFY